MEAEKVAPKPEAKAAGKGATWWVKEVARSWNAQKEYRDRAEKVIERYRDKRVNDTADIAAKRFNILYSNVETLGPAIYSQTPVPDIRRRHLDKDPIGRLCADILQRSVSYCLDTYDFDAVLDACKQDYLLPSFAVARVQYKPTFKKDAQGKEVELIYQEATTEYVPWDRFLMSRSKVYERVWWIAFGDDLTQAEIEEKFGKDVADKLSYGRREGVADGEDPKDAADPVCRVWEVWSKRGKVRFFVAEGFDGWVKAPEADPLRLERFYPNAKPVWAIQTNDTLEPVIEYYEYRDQALELDDLTERIDVLTSAVRRRGVHDAEFSSLAQMLTGKGDNNFVAVDNWARLMEKGGLEKLAMEMPLDGLVGAIVALDERRERVKQIIYEITGIGDIIRGASNPNETAKAQDIKSRWAGLRISTRQKKFANFARDLIRLKTELIAERFDPQTLSLMSGIRLPTQQEKTQWQQMQAMQQQQAQQTGQQPQPPNPQEAQFYAQPTWEEVIQVLRSDKLRGFKIDIETDSTIQPDADREKQARTELLTAIGQGAQQLAAGVQTGLISQEFAKETFAFVMRAFKAGTGVEESLDAMGDDGGMTPQQQQKEQELQQREQALMERESKVRDEEHKAQLAAKDAKLAENDLAHERELLDLEKAFTDKVQAVQDQFNQALQKLYGDAEGAVREAIKGQPQGAMQ